MAQTRRCTPTTGDPRRSRPRDGSFGTQRADRIDHRGPLRRPIARGERDQNEHRRDHDQREFYLSTSSSIQTLPLMVSIGSTSRRAAMPISARST
jgi:hypothetical protein